MKDKKCTQISLCFLLTATLCLEANVLKKAMTFAIPTTWTDARKFCRAKKVDLVPFEMAEELRLMFWMWNINIPKVWIGNYIDPQDSNVMRTINISGDNSTIWFPPNPDINECGAFRPSSVDIEYTVCSKRIVGVCLRDNLELVKEKKTWEEALQHCRDKIKCDKKGTCQQKYSLLTLKNPADYGYVRARIYTADTDEVWTGLRFLGGQWFWVDKEELKDEGELPRCPTQWKHCGTLSKTNKTNWITRDCSEKRNFICAYTVS